MTEVIREQRSGLGSRLHLSDDGWWVAYAQWPDRQAWERSQQSGTADVDAQQMMADAIEESMPPILLEPKVDLLLAAT